MCEEFVINGMSQNTPTMISQHMFRRWLGTVRRQIITRVNVEPNLCRHMATHMLCVRSLIEKESSEHWSYVFLALTHRKFTECNITRLDSMYHEHDDVIKWKHFPRYWSFVWGIHRSPVNSLHKGRWRRALMFSLICTLTNGWVNNREADDLRRHHAHYDVIVMNLHIVSFALFCYIWLCNRFLEYIISGTPYTNRGQLQSQLG